MGSNGNLRPPWKPGQSGNPKGRPPGINLTARLREILSREADVPEGSPSKTVADLVVEELVAAAARGDIKALSMLFDRVDGKVAQTIITEKPDLSKLSDEQLERLVTGESGGGA